MIADARLNAAKIFKTVSYSPELQTLSDNWGIRYLETVEQSLAALAAIKKNPDYCTFLSQWVGFDISEAFTNLEGCPLAILLGQEDRKYKEDIHYTRPVDSNATFELTVSKHSLMHLSPRNFKTAICHELGHVLQYGYWDCGKNWKRDPKGAYTDDSEHNWALEFKADIVAIACDPKNNNIGKMLANDGHSRKWMNRLYQKYNFPEGIADLLVKAVIWRDELVVQEIFGYGMAWPSRGIFINSFNFIFRMNCSFTHPADITRAVYGDRFASKALIFS